MTEDGEQDDSSESDESHPLDSPIESSLDWMKQRRSVMSPPLVENQYITMEKHIPQTSPDLPATSQKGEKKFLSLRRFTPSKRKTKTSKRQEEPLPLPPPQSHFKKYHTIAYRGELKPAVTTKTAGTMYIFKLEVKC